MDGNQNTAPSQGRRYFAKEIAMFKKIDLCGRAVYWEKIYQKLQNGALPEGDDLENMKVLHIEETEYTEDEMDTCLEFVAMFWDWLPKIMAVVGPYVEELTVTLAEEAAGFEYPVEITKMKIDFLCSIANIFPNLKALKLTGKGFNIENNLQQSYFVRAVENGKVVNIEYLDVDRRVSSSQLVIYVQMQLFRSPMLTEVKASVNQFSFFMYRAVLTTVKTVHLSNYGSGISDNTPKFVEFFVKTFPSIKTLRLIRTMNDEVRNLPQFLTGVQSTIKLNEFGIDQSGIQFVCDKPGKICGIKNIRIDLDTGIGSTLGFLQHLGDLPNIVLENWDKAILDNVSGPQEIKQKIITMVKAIMPDLQAVAISSSEDKIEVIDLA